MIDGRTARSIAAGWIGHDNPDLTAFATGHPGWNPEGLIWEVEREIDYVKAHPHHFDVDETIKDLGTAVRNVTELESLIEFVTGWTEAQHG